MPYNVLSTVSKMCPVLLGEVIEVQADHHAKQSAHTGLREHRKMIEGRDRKRQTKQHVPAPVETRRASFWVEVRNNAGPGMVRLRGNLPTGARELLVGRVNVTGPIRRGNYTS